MADNEEHIAADTFDDSDSAVGESIASDYTSLKSSIYNYQVENGRTYHSLSAGKYILPNDDSENDRLDLQHYLTVLAFEGRLALCPYIEDSERVLDMGTGTGIWAVEWADTHPSAHVIGVDLSPIQPSFVPPNCSFEIDDLEKDWMWQPFDFIFGRHLCASFADYQGMINKAFANLKPGGYLEMQDLDFPLRCDDGTMPKESPYYRFSDAFVDSCKNMGRPINMSPKYKEMFVKAGFEDVVEQIFKWPINQWPKDKKYKEIGAWNHANVDGGLEGLSMAPFTRGLGWTQDQVLTFCAEVRKDLRNTKMHAYFAMYVVYGRKPGGEKKPAKKSGKELEEKLEEKKPEEKKPEEKKGGE